MKRWIVIAAVAALVVTAIAPTAAAAPAAGNGGQQFVDDFVYDWTVDCGTVELTALQTGWAKVRVFDGKRNAELVVWHSSVVYTNPGTGDSWVWKDRGPDHFVLRNNADGELTLYWTVTGRSILNIIGHVVFNLETGELELVAGQQPFGGEPLDFIAADDYACDLLT